MMLYAFSVRQVHAVPVGEAVALHGGVVPAAAAAARDKRITSTCPATKSDRSYESKKI